MYHYSSPQSLRHQFHPSNEVKTLCFSPSVTVPQQFSCGPHTVQRHVGLWLFDGKGEIIEKCFDVDTGHGHKTWAHTGHGHKQAYMVYSAMEMGVG